MRLLILSSASSPKMLDLLGESAGGYLAAAVDVFSEKPQFRRVILANPITDLTLDCWGRFTQKGMKAAAFSPALCVGGNAVQHS